MNLYGYTGGMPANAVDPGGTTPAWFVKFANAWNSVVDPMNAYEAEVESNMRTIGFVKTWNIFIDMGDERSEQIVHAIAHPSQTYHGMVDTAASAIGHMTTEDEALQGRLSVGNWGKGSAYVVLSLVGVKDIGEASYNVDLVSGDLIDSSGGWNEQRVVKLSSGVSQSAFSLSGLAKSYDNVLTTGRLDRRIMFYHVTSTESAANIRSMGVDLLKGRPNLDFGQGFYVSRNLAQVTEYGASKFGADSVILRFDVSSYQMGTLNALKYPRASIGWAILVRSNRLGVNLPHAYDVISGPVLKGNASTILEGRPIEAFKAFDQTAFLTEKGAKVIQKGLSK